MANVHFSSKTDEWATPADFFLACMAEFGPFNLDACATPENAKVGSYYTKTQDSLAQVWEGVVWMNPPYGRGIGAWVAKAARAVRHPGNATRVVCLLPARTDTRWFHLHIWDAEASTPRPNVRLFFIPGRLKFGGAANAAPFPSMVVVFDRLPTVPA